MIKIILFVIIALVGNSHECSSLPRDAFATPVDVASFVAFFPFYIVSSILYIVGYIIRNIGLLFAYLDWIGACINILIVFCILWMTGWYMNILHFDESQWMVHHPYTMEYPDQGVCTVQMQSPDQVI